MTKEEYYDFPRSDYLNTIDKIYDDFESRTCDKCTYYRQGCDLVTFTSHEINDFGCLKFERKDK